MKNHYARLTDGRYLGLHGKAPRGSILIDESLAGKALRIVDEIEMIPTPRVQLDGDGNPVTQPALDGDGNPVMVTPTDASGNPTGPPEPVLEAVYELDGDGNPIIDDVPMIIGKKAELDPDAEAARIAAEAAEAAAEADREAKLAARAKWRARREMAQNLMDDIAILNEGKAWDVAATQAYVADPVIQSIMSLLQSNSLASARALIDASDLSSYYSTAEKDQILADIDAHLASEA